MIPYVQCLIKPTIWLSLQSFHLHRKDDKWTKYKILLNQNIKTKNTCIFNVIQNWNTMNSNARSYFPCCAIPFGNISYVGWNSPWIKSNKVTYVCVCVFLNFTNWDIPGKIFAEHLVFGENVNYIHFKLILNKFKFSLRLS